MAIEFTLNGAPVSVRDDHPHLLAAIREELDVTSPKDGCSPSGQCGCCTLMIDGKVQVSCQFPVARDRTCQEHADVKLADSWGDSTWTCVPHAEEIMINAKGVFIAAEDAEGLARYLRRRQGND